MAKFLVKRIFMALLTVFLVATITFFLMNAVPGNPWLSEKTPPQSVIDALNAKYGLDKPLPEQYVMYIGNLLHGDFGTSIKMSKNRPVVDMITEKFPVSASLGIVAVAWATLLGIPLGCIAAYRRGKFIDSLLRVVTTLGVSLPSFVVATTLMVVFCGGIEALHFFPSSYSASNGIIGYILPCFCLGLYPMCYVARLTRSSMLDAINQEYIKTAYAKGLKTFPILFKHALRNALIPVITYLGPLTAFTLCGGFVVENVFNIPGLGKAFVQSITALDYPMIMGTAIFLATFIVFMNLIVDILYKVVDPRINLAKGAD
ncbi:MAG: ABC transporter permease [Candidatus Treponema excrementipullorum]|uniref:ABC transporter permease n=1 Tax=Candidatus Treponema excrementipullorum TaxID=2838768 RepID=A0A9E2L212_9SPIR|nr:ABC transporter permease [Candidatus Treponema excrementipullorum]MCI6479618.1 ABC transporter permease [Spirochaetia bacterium]MCI6952629.1 ABC transporter permease [Spirochaetia bacterium]MCI7589379.1 ABC transporter permease [Spirochaetia bacterium]MDD7013318.1 ABC transporter permease [Candidatus Treponema excrementipullorum]